MTTCIESISCLPVNPTDVLQLWDIQYGVPTTIIMLGIILGTITLAIYMRNKSLPMLAILGIYETATFGAILTSKYVSSAYGYLPYIVGLALATAITMMILRLIKE